MMDMRMPTIEGVTGRHWAAFPIEEGRGCAPARGFGASGTGGCRRLRSRKDVGGAFVTLRR
jgi:hypothetical protein